MYQRRAFLASLGSLLATQHAYAQAYPAKPIRIISPFAAGGGSDFLARLLAAKLGSAMGQPVIVENKAGAGGALGTDFVAKAPPDGYTILIGSNGPLAVSPAFSNRLPYDPVRDLQPVALLTKQPFVLLTSASVPANDLREFIQLAKKQPGKLNYGTPGNGSAPHLAVEMLKMKTGMFITHIPYRGGPQALSDLLAGQIQLATADPNTAMPLLKQGRLRALAVTTANRSPLLPDVPTVAEIGISGYEVAGWFGALVPAGTPEAIVKRLNAEIAKVMASPEAKESLAGLGGDLLATTPAQFVTHIASETQRWRELIKTMNLKADN